MYDTIIIGSGPAGISASLYIKRAGFNVLVISNGNSALKKADKIENYYGFENPINGNELYNNGIAQAKKIGVEFLKVEVTGIQYDEYNGYEVKIANQGKDENYKSKYIIIATGVNRNRPKIEGLKELEGRGISYCAVCDAAFYRDKNVAVLGSGDYAFGEIDELIPIVRNVTMLTNGEKIEQKRLNIDINENKIRKVRGENRLEEVEFEDGTRKKLDGLFVAQGTASSIDFARKIGAKFENNNIVVNENMKTTIPGIYACGDCTGNALQISKAIYEGMKAGLEIIKNLREDK